MKDSRQDRLSDLCARALAETDPHEITALFSEINDILWKHILEVQNVIDRQRKREKSLQSRPHVM